MPSKPREGRGPVEQTAAEARLEELFSRPRQARTNGGPKLDVHVSSPDRMFWLAADSLVRRIADATDGANSLVFWKRNAAPPVILLEDCFITGQLNLRALDLPYLLEFMRCRFADPIDVRQAGLAGLQFTDCWLPSLSARNLRSASDVVLACSTVDGGTVDLTDSHINGSLVLVDSTLRNPDKAALHAERVTVAGALLADRVRVVGTVLVSSAKIGGNVDLCGAELHNPAGFTVDGGGIQVGGNLRLSADATSKAPFTSTGTIYLPDAKVAGELSLRGANLRPGERMDPPNLAENDNTPLERSDNPYWDPNASVVADRVEVNGDVEFDRGFTSTGTLRMVNARIGGSLRMAGATIDLSNPDSADQPLERALHFDGTDVHGGLNMQGADVTGQIRIKDLHVKGNARMDRAKISNPDAEVLLAERIEVGGNLVLSESRASGTLLLNGATIGVNLDLRGATLIRPGRHSALVADRHSVDLRAAKIGRDLVCAVGKQPFRAEGSVRMRRATIGREANFAGAVLGSNPEGFALNAFGVQTQDLVLTVATPPNGKMGLRHARCASLADNEHFWHAAGWMDVDDFRYEALATPVGLKDDRLVKVRLGWLRHALRDTYRPGPYDQLAAVFRASGNEEHTSTVLMEKQRLRYAALAQGSHWALRPLVLLWSWLQRSMVGYGYRSMRALGWLVVCLAIGTAWFWQHPLVEINVAEHQLWNPVLYTIDLLVPIVDFGNKGRWRPEFGPESWQSQWLSAALIATGWLLATTVAAGLTRMLKRT